MICHQNGRLIGKPGNWWLKRLTIALSLDKVRSKENYITANPNPEWWTKHLNAIVLKEARENGWLVSGRIGDFGCNHGACTILAARLGWHVTGIDMNRDAISLAKEMKFKEQKEISSRLEFICSRFDHLPLEDACLDGGYIFDVIEHIYPKDRRAIFSELHRVLKPGARLLITTPFDHAYDDGLQHVAFFVESTLSDMLTEGGWQVNWIVRDRRPDFHTPHGHDRLNALVEWKS